MTNPCQNWGALPHAAMVAAVLGSLGVATLNLVMAPDAQAAATTAPARVDATNLSLEVDALSALNDLQLSPDQVGKLRDMAKGAAGVAHAAPGGSDPEYLAATRALRKALLSGNANNIDTAEGKLADLEDQMESDPDPTVELSEAAKSTAEAAMKLLTSRQVAEYLGEISDGIPDASDVISAIDDSHQLSQEDFIAERDRLAEDFGTLAGGVKPAKQPKIVMKVKNLLDRARKIPDDQFAAKVGDLHAEAQQLEEGVDPIPGLRHCMEREMAELLSNPQLPHALDEWKPTSRNNSD